MTISVQFHEFINSVNSLEKATETVKDYLDKHPTFYKITLIVNHIFRAISMRFFMLALPFSVPASIALCLGAALFYRLTVEGNCAYKFALPAFLGAVSLPFAQTAYAAIISNVAFSSLSTFAVTLCQLLPLASYFAYIGLTVNYDVDQNCPKHPCCRK